MTSVQHFYDYYQDIIPDLEAFTQVCQTELPVCIWSNSLKIKADILQQSLHNEGVQLELLAWNPSAFRCISSSSMGRRSQYLTGLYQIQEEVSMLPVSVLDPQPGERILDMCAAPGNKTAQIATAMNNTGTLIANDKNYGRMRALGQISKRLGLLNIGVSIHDATTYPNNNDYFDKVLVDAPCSCEGTLRKNLKKEMKPNVKHSRYLARQQLAILRKAFLLCKPGGKIVYSTCTFSPLENEAVVDQFLQEFPGQIVLQPISISGFTFSEGLQSWQDISFSSEVKKTARIWPQQNNTGGFFMALFEKCGELVANTPSNLSAIPDSVREHLDTVIKRFGFPNTIFNHYRFSDNNRRGIYIMNADYQPPDNIKLDMSGLFFIKTKIRFPKLTSAAVMMFGDQATQNYVELDDEQVAGYRAKEDIELCERHIQHCTDTGYVLVQYNDQFIGQGVYLSAMDGKPPRLRSMYAAYLQGP